MASRLTSKVTKPDVKEPEKTEPKQMTYQEAINNLENQYVTKLKVVTDLKDKLVVAQDELFKSLQNLASVKEEFLRAVLEQEREQRREASQILADPAPETHSSS